MKTCKIIGYGEYKNKENNTLMLRICYGIKSTDERYIGTKVGICFLDSTEDLKENLNNVIFSNLDVKYETTDDVISGKTKIKKLIFN